MNLLRDKAPQFELPDAKGDKVALSQLLSTGKKVVVVFYRGGWCPLCSRQLASLAQDYKQFKQKGAMIVAISNEIPVKGKKLLTKLQLPYTLLVDEQSEAIQAFGVKVAKREFSDIPALLGHHKDYALPSVFIINQKAEISWKYIGKNYRDRPKNSQILANL